MRKNNHPRHRTLCMIMTIVMLTCTCAVLQAQQPTRGIGVYPGSPEEYFGPDLGTDSTLRNIALHRPAYASSSYDYNLTAQLVTDGILATASPPYLIASTPEGPLPRRSREWSIDGNDWTANTLLGEQTWLDLAWHRHPIQANRIVLHATVVYHPRSTGHVCTVKAHTSNQGRHRNTATVALDTLPGKALTAMSSDPNKQTATDRLPAHQVTLSIPLRQTSPFDRLRLQFDMPGAAYWQISEVQFFQDDQPVTDVLPSSAFTSAWMSDEAREQWLYVDLGNRATIHDISLHWLSRPEQGHIEVSDDAVTWSTIAMLPRHSGKRDHLRINSQGRYLRLVMNSSHAAPYILSEIEVMGRGGLTAFPPAEPTPTAHRRSLNGGNWRIQRSSETNCQKGEELSLSGIDTSKWITATVPSTILASYIHAGAVPDPNFDNNYLQLSESFFNGDFWYRRTFTETKHSDANHTILHFDGINWKADIYLNGQFVGHIDGAFQRGRFDITPILSTGENVLAVHIHPVAHPGAFKEKNSVNTQFNGGILGADNPTFHATIGWDWITTTPGRNIGIWNDVYLTYEGGVSLSDPLVTSIVSTDHNDTLATMTPRVILHNNTSQPVTGILKGHIGSITFEKVVKMDIGESREETFSPILFDQLHKQHMHLWWPNGYGTPYLYDAGFEWIEQQHAATTASVHYKAGICQISYEDMNTALKILVNGQRVVPRGGNWGFSEANLRYRGREYDIAVRNHRDMNCNMIRNWVGQTGDEEFYEACDRYGIMVWQDFWLANPVDGPNPDQEQMFLENARDYLLRIRNHPSIALYCGRNEGYPPSYIDTGLRQHVAAHHPDIGYISSSADEGVSGHGPYRALPAKEYFNRQTGKLHSERGMPNVMNIESLRRTLRPSHLWPQNDTWGQHDYTLQGAQAGTSFNALISQRFGTPTDALQFSEYAQWINYDGYRAMFESQNTERQGLLIWMSHPCWPSMVWQTYDYYFDPTAAYFGVKKACEPLHIQWDASSHYIEVVNYTATTQRNLRMTAEAFDPYTGRSLWRHVETIDIEADATKNIGLYRPDSLVLLRLQLTDSTGCLRSQNDYMLPEGHGGLAETNLLCPTHVTANMHMLSNATEPTAMVELENTGVSPAFMIRLNLKDSNQQQVLPVWYEDNYIHLLPGERRSITVRWQDRDLHAAPASISITGFNLLP